jgi:hypothetical protein
MWSDNFLWLWKRIEQRWQIIVNMACERELTSCLRSMAADVDGGWDEVRTRKRYFTRRCDVRAGRQGWGWGWGEKTQHPHQRERYWATWKQLLFQQNLKTYSIYLAWNCYFSSNLIRCWESFWRLRHFIFNILYIINTDITCLTLAMAAE